MKNLNRGFSSILLLVAAILVIGGGTYLYSQGKLPGTSIGNSSQQQGATTDLGNGWKRYSNSKYHFSVDFPSDTPVKYEAGTVDPKGGHAFIGTQINSQPVQGTSLVITASELADNASGYGIGLSGGNPQPIEVGGTQGTFEGGEWSGGNDSVGILSGPHGNIELRIWFVPVAPQDLDKYSALIKQIAATVMFN